MAAVMMNAIGAQKRDLIQLFVMEAIVPGVPGSVIGTSIGVVASYLIADLLEFPLVFVSEWFAVIPVLNRCRRSFGVASRVERCPYRSDRCHRA